MRRKISAFALVLIMILGMPVSVSADTSPESGKTVINSINLEIRTSVTDRFVAGGSIPMEASYEGEEILKSSLKNVPKGATSVEELWMVRYDAEAEADADIRTEGGWVSANGKYGRQGSGIFEADKDYLLLYIITVDNEEYTWNAYNLGVEGVERAHDVEVKRVDGPRDLIIGRVMGKPASGGDEGSLFIAEGKASGKSISYTWSKVKGASKYRVYFAKCGKKYTRVKTTQKRAYLRKGLKKDRTYKLYVEAVNSKGRVLARTPKIHIVTEGGDRSNVKRLKGSRTLALKPGQSASLNAKVAEKTSKRRLIKGHVSQQIRYYSADRSVARVDSNGTVTGVKAGAARIYAVAANGVKLETLVKVSEPATSAKRGTPVYIEGQLTWIEASTWQEAIDKGLRVVIRNGGQTAEARITTMEYEMTGGTNILSEDASGGEKDEIPEPKTVDVLAIGFEISGGAEFKMSLGKGSASYSVGDEEVITDFGRIEPYTCYRYSSIR